MLGDTLDRLVGLFIENPERFRVARAFARRDAQPMNLLEDGADAFVRGTVTLLPDTELVESPLSKLRCVYWRIQFDEVGAQDHRALGRLDGGIPFLLTSDTGRARVIPGQPLLAVAPIRVERESAINFVNNALARTVCKRPNHPLATTLRSTEYILQAGVVIDIAGHCTLEPDPDASAGVSGYVPRRQPDR